MKVNPVFLILFVFFCSLPDTQAEVNDSTAVSKIQTSRLTLGGYGEAVYTRNFFSGNPFRYMRPASYKNDPSHGRFDLPHVVFFVGYEFGNGWRINSEIEFEHGGTEAAVEVEPEESGEYEQEVERGGEVALEQFWIEKTFNKALNLRAGHIIVPVGLTNGNHLPTQFFTVYRPEGENTILPCTWHETGISLWGHFSDWRYEVMLLPGLDSDLFGRDKWIGGASASPYEFKIANKYAGALRIDNYSVPGLRMGISAYYGESFGQTEAEIYDYLMSTTLPAEMTDEEYIEFMVWHRGLAVPAARNLDDPTVQKGKKLFYEAGCASCHRPSWTTGPDDYKGDPMVADKLPRYPYQKIWPYSDFLQHRLNMVNDIRTGWCRTTPLWGRGLSEKCTGAGDHLHDMRARNYKEAIMWHGGDARGSRDNFYYMSKEDRDALVKFLESI